MEFMKLEDELRQEEMKQHEKLKKEIEMQEYFN
jgi:hypothetical protein